MKNVLGMLLIASTLVACSNDTSSTNDDILTKSFVEENAEVGLTYDEVRERFGKEELGDVVDNTETWLYDATSEDDFEYDKTLEVVAFEEIKSGDVDAQLYITFVEEKAFVYSYFYLGVDGRVWQYQVSSYTEPLHIPVSD